MYDVLKSSILGICKTIAGRKYIILQGGKVEEKIASLTIIVTDSKNKSIYFQLKGDLNESDKEMAFDCLKTAIKNYESPNGFKDNCNSTFNKDLNEWQSNAKN